MGDGSYNALRHTNPCTQFNQLGLEIEAVLMSEHRNHHFKTHSSSSDSNYIVTITADRKSH